MPPFKYVSVLLSDAFVIAIVGFSVSVSLTFIFAKRNKYEVSSNQVWYLNFYFLCFYAISYFGVVNFRLMRRKNWIAVKYLIHTMGFNFLLSLVVIIDNWVFLTNLGHVL